MGKPIFVDYYKGMILACKHVAEKKRKPDLQDDGVLVCGPCRDKKSRTGKLDMVHTYHPRHLQTESGRWCFEEDDWMGRSQSKWAITGE